MMKTRRYPGVQPFGDDDIQRELFKGRDEEKYELFQLVLAERLVLLFARSGIGKSSLINAGLLKPLRERSYIPLVVRVSGSPQGPMGSLYEGIREAARDADERWEIATEPEAERWNRTSLWHFFKTTSFWQGPKLLSPVLIIDQFEELFTLYSAEERESFIRELSDLVRGTRPRSEGEQEGRSLSDTPPEVKVVLALREDFYAQLEELRTSIPAVYKAPFRLEPLTRDKARQAIIEPAAVESDDFEVPNFEWQDDAVDRVLDFLSERQLGGGKTAIGNEVEPFQLQLVCQHFENMVADRNLASIGVGDLGGQEALTRVLSSFYEDSLSRTCDRFSDQPDLRQKLERLCEYGFITARGRRLLREESTIQQEDGVTPEVLRHMVECRLLRKEPRVGDNYYELTHDTLIDPIKLSRVEREEREAAEREAQRQREAMAQAKRELQLKRRYRKAVAAAAVFLVFVVGAAFYAWDQDTRKRSAVAAAQEEIAVANAKRDQAVATARSAVQVAEQVTVESQRQVQQETERADTAAQQANTGVLLARTAAVLKEDLVKLGQQQQDAAVQVLAAEQASTGNRESKSQIYQARSQFNQISRMLENKRIALELLETKVDQTAMITKELAASSSVVQVQAESDGAAQQLEELKRNISEIEQQDDPVDPSAAAATQTAAEPKQPVGAEEENADDDKLVSEIVQPTAGDGANAGSGAGNGRLNASETPPQKAGPDPARAKAFEELKAAFPDMSLCERFDAMAKFEPDPAIAEQTDFKLAKHAELTLLKDKSAVVVTQKNLLAGPAVSEWQQCRDSPPKASRSFSQNDTLCLYFWIRSPEAGEEVRFEVKEPDGNLLMQKNFKLGQKNTLSGERMGYRIWHAKTLRKSGEHQLLLYNPSLGKDELICRTTIDVE